MSKTIYVYESWSGETPIKLGKLYVDQGRGSEHYSFEYDEAWLTSSRFAHVLDPDLALYKGRQYPINKNTFGILISLVIITSSNLFCNSSSTFIRYSSSSYNLL